MDENGYYPTLSKNDAVGVVDVGDADRGPGGHIVVEVDTFFEKDRKKKIQQIPAGLYTCSTQNAHNNPESFKLCNTSRLHS